MYSIQQSAYLRDHRTAERIAHISTRSLMLLSPYIPVDVPAYRVAFPGLRIGIAEYNEGPTGVTVFHFPERAFAVVDVRGGAPGTSLTDTLRMSFGKFVNGIAFCGGSVYGFEAAAGVATGLLESDNASTKWGEIAVVPAAVVFDFNGRTNHIYPDHALGRAALESAHSGWFPYGTRGAGRFVHSGAYFGQSRMEQSGQGAAFADVGTTKLAVFTVVNARGALMDRAGNTILGNCDRESGQRTAIRDDLRRGKRPEPAPSPTLCENTTLTLLITNRCLRQDELWRLAITTHSSMARAIQPFPTERDGDTLFVTTTGDITAEEPNLSDLSVLASELAWDAVLNCIPQNPGRLEQLSENS